MASNKNGTIYTGVTSNLLKRVYEHKNGIFKGFTDKYSVHLLVYYEIFESIEMAIQREKSIKGKNRVKKLELIEKRNPDWKDLSEEWLKDS